MKLPITVAGFCDFDSKGGAERLDISCARVLPFLVDANVHFSCARRDAAIQFIPLVVKSHGLLSCFVYWGQGLGGIHALQCRNKRGGSDILPVEKGPLQMLVGDRHQKG